MNFTLTDDQLRDYLLVEMFKIIYANHPHTGASSNMIDAVRAYNTMKDFQKNKNE